MSLSKRTEFTSTCQSVVLHETANPSLLLPRDAASIGDLYHARHGIRAHRLAISSGDVGAGVAALLTNRW